jgi:Rhs element Vgr protein
MSVATPTILSEGKVIDPGYELVSIDIRKEVSRIPSAYLTLLDGDVENRTFPISDAEIFEPGKEIEIKLRYEGETSDRTVFRGRVIRHGLEADEKGSLLRVEVKDAAVRLTQTRKSQVFRKKTDYQVIQAICEAAKLRFVAGDQDPRWMGDDTEIVQYHCSDWDFIVSRADINGLLVVVDDGRISLHSLQTGGSPRHSFEYGLSEIYNFETDADASFQYEKFQSIGWSIQQQQTRVESADPFSSSQGNLDGARLARTIGAGTYTLSHMVPMDRGELKGWASSRLLRSRMSMIRGRLSLPGFADIALLDLIEIKGIGKRFNGRTPVTGIRHRVDGYGWRTDLQFGLSPHWFCREDGIQDSPAAGLLPAVSGLQIGIVDRFEDDPAKEFRVRVILPGIDAKAGWVWARCVSPDAGSHRGFFFRPEAGDEVVVGFLNDDPRQPVILGAMFSSGKPPPKDYSNLAAENLKKGIVTKSGTKFGIVDGDKPSLFIETPASSIRLDDQAEAIRITDQHGNIITMDKEGIQLKSVKDLKIEASGNVEIKGRNVDVK